MSTILGLSPAPPDPLAVPATINTMLFDYFVGAVAIIMGTALILGAAANASWLMRLAKVRSLSERVGGTGARLVCGLMGATIILLGIVVATGWRPPWAQAAIPPGSQAWQTAT